MSVSPLLVLGCSRPTECEKLFATQVRCSWSERDTDRDRFVRECKKTFAPLLDCAKHSDCDPYKRCVTATLEARQDLVVGWRRLLVECGLDTEGAERSGKKK